MTAERIKILREEKPLLRREKPVSLEPLTWKLAVDTPSIRIAGPAGSGKTTVADALSQLLGLDIMKVGQQDRQMVPTDTDFRPRQDAYDRALDTQIQTVLETATPDKPVIVDSHLALVWGKLADQKNPTGPGISILVIADEEERMKRIMPRQNDKKRTKGEPELTLEETTAQTKRRHDGNLAKWKDLYADEWVENQDPHIATKADLNNPRFIVIDTTTATSAKETIALAIDTLVERSIIEKIKTQPIEVFPGKSQASSFI